MYRTCIILFVESIRQNTGNKAYPLHQNSQKQSYIIECKEIKKIVVTRLIHYIKTPLLDNYISIMDNIARALLSNAKK